MKHHSEKAEKGFSLIELLLVIVIIGVIASLAIPYYVKAKRAAENSSVIGSLSVMRSSQLSFFSQKTRFARMDELNTFHGALGTTVSPTSLRRGTFIYVLDPLTSTDAQLKSEYRIVATKESDNQIPYVFTMSQAGTICQTEPVIACIGS